MAKVKQKMIGYKMGNIFITEELPSKFGHRRFVLTCSICLKKTQVYHSQINTGKWSVCEHDA